MEVMHILLNKSLNPVAGLLEIISPPSEFYPDFTKLKQTLGDEMERVVWRSKQVHFLAHPVLCNA